MSSQQLPLQLEELFFPIQELRANPEFNPEGEKPEIQVNQAMNMHPYDGNGRFGIQIEITNHQDVANNPYFFTINGYAIVAVDPKLDQATQHAIAESNGQLILIGAIRERLLDLTARAPWGRYLLPTLPVIAQKKIDS